MLPIQKFQLIDYANVWAEYDPQGTGFMDIDDLDAFIVALAKTRDGKDLLVGLDAKLLKNSNLRRRFLCMLSVPTYHQMKKLMFYDLL